MFTKILLHIIIIIISMIRKINYWYGDDGDKETENECSKRAQMKIPVHRKQILWTSTNHS